MAYAMFSDPVNGVSDVLLRRERPTKIIVTTVNPLDDDQMQDLYWVVLMMVKTGLTLKEIMMDKKEDDDELQE